MAEKNTKTITKKLADLSILLEISKAMILERNLDTLLDLIAKKTREVMTADRISLFIVDHDASELWTHIAQDLEIKEIRLPVGRGIAGYVAKSGDIVNIADAYKDPRFDQNSDKKTGYHTKTVLCAPLINHESKIIGVIQVLNKADGIFTKYDEELLVGLCAQAAVAIENASLYKEIELSFKSMLKTMAAALDARDPISAGHSERVAKYAIALARAVGFSEEEIKIIDYAAALHDIGKIGVPDSVLLKPGKLTPEEYNSMKQHAVKTKDILEQVHFARKLRDIPTIASAHHEKLDGSGYPLGLKGVQISKAARILTIADVYDALVSYDRPYKRAMTVDEAIEVLKEGKDTSFDPDLVDVFIKQKLYLIDRREFQRVNADLTMEYTVITKDEVFLSQPKDTKLLNISAEGLMFFSEKFLPAGTFLDVTLHLPEINMNVLARIVRVARMEGQNRFELGLKFVNLSRATKERLDKYLVEMVEQ